MITSHQNQKIKNVITLKSKAKARKEQGVFIVEGIRMLKEVPAGLVKEVYVTKDFYEKNKALLAKYEDQRCLDIVTDDVFMKMTDTVTPQGVIVIVKMLSYEKDEVLKGHFLLLLENIQDPGNLGTLFRTAEGAGIDAVIMSKGTADIFNPKVIRSTMGSIFRMPYMYTDNLEMDIGIMRASGFKVYAAALESASEYTTADYTGKSAILIGNEGNGLLDNTIRAAGHSVFIPMQGKVESLNASISGAILMYEAARQRKID